MADSAPDLERLRAVAEAACSRAYAPYSEFTVGAALLSRAGNVYPGCNVENASYPLALCAERTAITSAVAAEGPSMRIAEVVIVTGRGITAAPCGACRQVINEFAQDTSITLLGDGGPLRFSLTDLLPHAFGPSDLERPAGA